MNEKVKGYLEDLKHVAQDKGYSQIRFEFRMLENDDNILVDHLDLKVRPIHALKSAKIFTLKDLAERVDSSANLKGIQNLGAKSIREIMTVLIGIHIERNITYGRKPYDGITLC